MSGEEPSWSAALTISAREKNARGDAVIARLALEPERSAKRGSVAGVRSGAWLDTGRPWPRSWAQYRAEGTTPNDLGAGVVALLARLAPHSHDLQSLGDAIAVSLDIVPYGIVAPWRIDFTEGAVCMLADLNAALVIDAYVWAPAGTEEGPVCNHCRLVRPASADDARVPSLCSTSPARGMADARLILDGVTKADDEALFDAMPAWSDYVASQRTFVAAARVVPIAGPRGGAVALATLLRAVREGRRVSELAARATSRRAEVRCWVNYFRDFVRVKRRDLGRLAKLSAALSCRFESAALPAFTGGACYHCAYKLPGFIHSAGKGPMIR